MIKHLFLPILFSILNFETILAQNLVMNPSFEDYWHLQKQPAYLTDTFFCKNWTHIFNSYHSTVDYYTEDNVVINYEGKIIKLFNNVPDNISGYHPTHSGKSYAGFILMSMDGYLEHLTGMLYQPLTKGKTYTVSFYLRYRLKCSSLFFNKIEVLFSSDSNLFIRKKSFEEGPIYKQLFSIIKPQADIEYNITEIKDTTWTKFTCQYIAKGNEKFITFGMFYQDEKISQNIVKITSGFNNLKSKKLMNRVINHIHKKIPFIKKNLDFEKYCGVGGGRTIDAKVKDTIVMGGDGGYYFIDDVSVELVK